MKLFRTAAVWQADTSKPDWTRDYGYAKVSEFPFPDLYFDNQTAELAEQDERFVPFLNACLENFTNHEYGHMSSLDLVENHLSRDIHKKNTWMRGIYPSEYWGEVKLEIFYDRGMIHLGEVAPRDIAMSQAKKEREAKAERDTP